MMQADRTLMMLVFVLTEGLVASSCCYIKVNHFGRRDLLAPMSSGRDADSRVFCSGVCCLAEAARVQCCTPFSARCSALEEPLEGCWGAVAARLVDGPHIVAGDLGFRTNLEPRLLAPAVDGLVWPREQASKQYCIPKRTQDFSRSSFPGNLGAVRALSRIRSCCIVWPKIPMTEKYPGRKTLAALRPVEKWAAPRGSYQTPGLLSSSKRAFPPKPARGVMVSSIFFVGKSNKQTRTSPRF